ncbi:low density lipoprotein receptor adapter protein 1-A-like [Tubulanus polymorphus]|uniref:low density lipoprotein receptor adapter protein 1-A-like n=1 Tax=Tubulanus polymorphus TaxID=672921 RepID=UPI003DA1E8FD
MFNWRGTIIFSEDDPEFQVRFLGYTDTLVSSGKGCTKLPVQKLVDSLATTDERSLRKAVITVNTSGLFLREKHSKHAMTDKFDIRYISYCSADTDIHPKLFSWVYNNKAEQQMQCYAVYCSSSEKANMLALELSRAFHVAYTDWKLNKTRQERQKNTRIRQRTLSTESSASSDGKGKLNRSSSDPVTYGIDSETERTGGHLMMDDSTVGFESANLLSDLNITDEECDDCGSVENNAAVLGGNEELLGGIENNPAVRDAAETK